MPVALPIERLKIGPSRWLGIEDLSPTGIWIARKAA